MCYRNYTYIFKYNKEIILTNQYIAICSIFVDSALNSCTTEICTLHLYENYPDLSRNSINKNEIKIMYS